MPEFCTICGKCKPLLNSEICHKCQNTITRCIACGINSMEYKGVFCNSCKQQFAQRVKDGVAESTIIDDMIFNNNKDSISIGTKVRCKETGDIGTVIFIALQNAPFRVKWDNNKGIDPVDWFLPNQLERV